MEVDTRRNRRILEELITLNIKIAVAKESHKKALRSEGSEKRITQKRLEREEFIIQFNQKKREL